MDKELRNTETELSALKAFGNDSNSYRYLFHISNQTATSDLIAMTKPDINLPPHFQRANTGLVRVNNNNNSTLISHIQDALRFRVQKEKPSDYCHACYSYDAEGMPRTYFENLGKEIISDIGLDSFDGIYAASRYSQYHYKNQY